MSVGAGRGVGTGVGFGAGEGVGAGAALGSGGGAGASGDSGAFWVQELDIRTAVSRQTKNGHKTFFIFLATPIDFSRPWRVLASGE